MKIESVYMGTMVKAWMSHKNIKNITFSVTEDCNLKCDYCYFTHKNHKNKMSFDIAKKAVDYILSEEKFLIHDGVVWDFIGGEPTLEIDLIDKICEYILYKMFVMNHKWLYCYRFMIGTNGLLYASDKFQKLIRKYSYNLHVAVTIDGSKEKHDLSRKKKDGTGSYDDIVKVLPLWLKQTGNISTKSTFAHADLPYLKDSIINLWNLGIKNVMANVVFEDVWHEGDDIIFESQLKELADYVIDNNLWNNVSVRFFSPGIGFPLSDHERKTNNCGTGNMMAIDYRGRFYPCVRFMDTALNNREGRIIGDIDSGINTDIIRAFNAVSYDAQSAPECCNCDVASGCAWCSGFNYDKSKEGTIFERQTFQCKMHKANIRANRYFWSRYEEKTKKMSPLRYNMYTRDSSQNEYLYIYKNNAFNYCYTDYLYGIECELDDRTYLSAINFCFDNNFIPVHVGFDEQRSWGYYIGSYNSKYSKDEFTIDVIEHEQMEQALNSQNLSSCIIYRTSTIYMEDIVPDIEKLFQNSVISKVSVIIKDYYTWTKFDLQRYDAVLKKLADYIVNMWEANRYIQIDIITDNLFADRKIKCSAGINSFTLAPNGQVYSCIAHYYNNEKGINNLNNILEYKKTFPSLLMCKSCEVFKCNMCSYLNQQLTLEPSVAFELHCVKANMELNATVIIRNAIHEKNLNLPFDINDRIRKSPCVDPLIAIRGDTYANQKLYDALS